MSPRGVQTSLVKKSAPAISPQWARRNVRQDDGRSGAGGIPLALSALATVLLATPWPRFFSACPFHLAHPGLGGPGCGRSADALGLGCEGQPAWTNVVRGVQT